MAYLNEGLATFASCNKAGSIPFFNQHLEMYPSDDTALMWRGRAHSIIEERESALMDFKKAASVSNGVKKLLAESYVASMEGDGVKQMEKLQTAVQTYPLCGEAWWELGTRQYLKKDFEGSLPNLKQSIELGKSCLEKKEPWYPWSNALVGDIYYNRTDVKSAEAYYTEATNSCDSLTIAHLGISKCNVINGDETKSEQSFNRAKHLNPKLVPYAQFSDFKDEVNQYVTNRRINILLDVMVAYYSFWSPKIGRDFASNDRLLTTASNGGDKDENGGDNAVDVNPRPLASVDSGQQLNELGAGLGTEKSADDVDNDAVEVYPTPLASVDSGQQLNELGAGLGSEKCADDVDNVSTLKQEDEAKRSINMFDWIPYLGLIQRLIPSVLVNRNSGASAITAISRGNQISGLIMMTGRSLPSTYGIALMIGTVIVYRNAYGMRFSDVVNWAKTSITSMLKPKKGVQDAKFASGGSQSASERNGDNRKDSGVGGNDGDHGDDGNTIWKEIQKKSPSIKKLADERHFVKVGKYWLTRDKAEHAGSYCKLYIEKGSTLDFECSVTKNIFKNGFKSNPKKDDFDTIENKRESSKDEKIKKKDLQGVK